MAMLVDPTTHLRDLLNNCDHRGAAITPDRCREALAELHDHIVSGGALPEQWRGPGTAVYHLLWSARLAVAIWEETGGDASDGKLAIAKVEGA